MLECSGASAAGSEGSGAGDKSECTLESAAVYMRRLLEEMRVELLVHSCCEAESEGEAAREDDRAWKAFVLVGKIVPAGTY